MNGPCPQAQEHRDGRMLIPGLTGRTQQASPSAVSPGARAGDLLTLIDQLLVHTPAADPSPSFQRNQPCPLCGAS